MINVRLTRNILFLLSCLITSVISAQTITIPFKTDSTKIEIEFEGEINGTDTIKNGSYTKHYLYSDVVYEEGSYKDNKKHGLFITYFENKKKHWVRSYQNGLLFGDEAFYSINETLEFTGIYTILDDHRINYNQYFPTGELKKTIELIDNTYHGREVTFFTSGDTNTVKAFDHGKLDGPFEIRNEDQVTLQKGHYRNGELTKTLKSYYENKNLKSEGNFSHGRPNGIMKDYYSSGNLKRNCFYKNDTLEGSCTTYYENGNVSTEAVFFKGHFDKLFLEYFESGKLKDSINYTRSQKDGESKHFDSTGNLLSREYFKLGIFDKKQLAYYPSGQLKKEYNYKNGRKTGENYSYFEDGRIESILIFNSDDQITSEKIFWSNDKLKTVVKHKYKKVSDANQKVNYDDVANEKSYYQTGALSQKGTLLNGKKHGSWTEYFDNGAKKGISEYKYNRKHGEFTEYHKNKKVALHGYYVSNKKVKVWSYFNEQEELIRKENYKNNILNGAFFIKNKDNSTSEGVYKRGKKHGTWTTIKEGKVTTEKYVNNKLVTN